MYSAVLMKFPLSRKTLVIGSGILLVVFVIGYFATRGSAKVIYVTDTAKLGNVVKTVDITGSLSPLSHADLSFQSSGNVAQIFVGVGELVRKGQPLASLSASDLSADARRAQADLDLALADPKPEDIAAAQADVKSAQVAADNAVAALATTKMVNEVNLKTSANALTKAKEDQTKSLENSNRTTLNALQTAVIQIRTGLSKADQLLGIENTFFNDGFEREFGAENPQAVQSANDSFDLAAVDRDLAEPAVVTLTKDTTNASQTSAITLTLRALQETSDTLLYTRQALDGTAADSVDLSLDDIVAYKSLIDTARSNVESARSTLTDARDTADQDAITQAHSVLTAELSTENTQAIADRDEANAEATILSTKATLEKANAAFSKVTAPPRHVDVAPYIASRDSASARFLKTEIISPIEGKIGKVNMKLGEAITAGISVISLEPTTTTYEIVVDVPESDIAHLTLGDTATVTFDAFGSDTIFTGTLSSLDRSEKLIEGVVFYEARIAIVDGARMKDLRNGMSADVTVLTETKTSVLTIPTRAVLENNGEKIVRVLVNGEIQEKIVVLGLRGDDGLTEIISGLTAGDTVVVSIKK